MVRLAKELEDVSTSLEEAKAPWLHCGGGSLGSNRTVSLDHLLLLQLLLAWRRGAAAVVAVPIMMDATICLVFMLIVDVARKSECVQRRHGRRKRPTCSRTGMLLLGVLMQVWIFELF